MDRLWSCSDVLFVALLSSMLLAPTMFMGSKLALILLIGFFNLLSKQYNTRKFEPIVYGIIALILLNGVYNISSGILFQTLNSEKLIKVIPFNLIHPLLFFLLIPNMKGIRNIKRVCNAFVLIYFLLMSRDLYNVIALMNGLPPLLLSEEETYVVTDNSIGILSSSHYPILIIMPVFFTLGLCKKISGSVFVIGIVLTFIALALSGSVARVIIFLLCWFIPLILNRVGPSKINYWHFKKVALILIPIVLFFGFVFISEDQFDSVKQNVENHFDSDTDIRFEQRQTLLNAWAEAPVFGHGYGASFRISARGLQSEFESMYHARLATTGIVGLALMLGYLFAILYLLVKKIQNTGLDSPYYLAAFLCLVSAIICSSTNPGLGTFDGLIPIYLCISCIAESSA